MLAAEGLVPLEEPHDWELYPPDDLSQLAIALGSYLTRYLLSNKCVGSSSIFSQATES